MEEHRILSDLYETMNNVDKVILQKGPHILNHKHKRLSLKIQSDKYQELRKSANAQRGCILRTLIICIKETDRFMNGLNTHTRKGLRTEKKIHGYNRISMCLP